MFLRRAIACLLLCSGCTPDSLVPQGDPDRTTGHRVALPHIAFDLWTDVLTLQAGLCDEGCTFLDPIVVDDSVAWAPLQVFWVIYDNPDDVLDGDAVFDTFWNGDEVTATDFEARDGLNPLGFQFVQPVQQGLVPLKSTELSADRRTLTGELGGGVDALIRATSTPGEEGCTVQAEWCPSPCEDAGWTPFTSLYLELSALRTVQSYDFRNDG